jgi:hypothetical protein
MSEKVTILYYTLWILHPVLQMTIAGFMLRRGLLRQFKFFFAYIITQLLSFAVVFPAYVWRSYSALFYLYWGCTAISVACGFLVIHEVFVDVFRAFHTLRDLGTVLFKWAGLVMLLVAGVVSVSNTSTLAGPVMGAIVTAQRCTRIIQVGMVLFLLFFAHYVGVSRRQHSFGIALGFGAFACVELLLVASWVGHHLGGPWMSYVAVRRPTRELSTSQLQSHRWEQSLSDIQHPVPADSLIPMFEGMVDRALSRSRPAEANGSAQNSTGSVVRAAVSAAEGFAAAVRAGSKS